MKNRRHLAAVFLVLLCLIPQYTAQTAEPSVALTFDDGPAGRITEKLLDALAERNVRATFFLCCYRMESYPAVVQKMAQDGHEIGIHGCSHLYFTQMPKDKLQAEIACTANTIKNLAGTVPSLLRPPGGLYNETVRRTAEEAGLSILLWSVDPEDWDPAMRRRTVRHVVTKAKHGDIILLHDLSEENITAALEIVDMLTKKGFRFCTVSELAELNGQMIEAGKIYRQFS